MWTATIVQGSIKKDTVSPSMDVLFTDGKYRHTETINLIGVSPDDIKKRIESIRQNCINSYGFIDTLDETFDLTVTPPEPPTPPTQDQLDAIALAQKHRDFLQAKADLDAGWITQDEADAITNDALSFKDTVNNKVQEAQALPS